MDILKEQLKRSKELMGIINESTEVLYEGMDATNIDLEKAAEATNTDQKAWMEGDWDELDDNMKETFKQHKEFQGMDESQIREKFNSMEKGPLCKIIRGLVGWIWIAIRGGYSAFDKEMRQGMGGGGYKPAWRC